MEHLKWADFQVDSHIERNLASTAQNRIDHFFGEKLKKSAWLIRLSPGSLPTHCRWESGNPSNHRWGFVYKNGRTTEWNGKEHVTLK